MQQRSRILWTLAVLLVGVVLVKFFFADVYGVNSGSMRPTIFGGAARPGGDEFREWVLVAYDRAPELARFDLAVIRPEHGGDPVVKRVVGLPGETVRVAGGDLLIDGERLDGDAARPPLIPVFDDRYLPVEDFFELTLAPEGPWTRAGDGWRLHAPADAADAWMRFHKDLHDDYLDENGARVVGTRQVNDAAVACDVVLEEWGAGARLAFRLVEEADVFEAAFERVDGGTELVLTRGGTGDTEGVPEVLARRPVDFAPRPSDAGARAIAFANVDNHLLVLLDGRALLNVSYEANVPLPAHAAGGPKSVGPRVALGGAGCTARFERIRVLRDLYYTPAGEHATHAALSLGPGEYFLLGDNSASSTDSRFFGPVAAGTILGRPLAVVRPLGRARRLTGGVPPEELVP